jgi:hypothetical protein
MVLFCTRRITSSCTCRLDASRATMPLTVSSCFRVCVSPWPLATSGLCRGFPCLIYLPCEEPLSEGSDEGNFDDKADEGFKRGKLGKGIP